MYTYNIALPVSPHQRSGGYHTSGPLDFVGDFVGFFEELIGTLE